MLTESQLEIIRATVPVLREHGETITRQFYQFLFDENPELKNLFNMASQAKGEQPRALAESVLAYAANIDALQNLGPAVSRIAHKHASLDVPAAGYPVVGRNLIKAIGAVLGDAATPDIVDAWTAAYGELAKIFIKVEGDMYTDDGERGWTGFKPFKVAHKETESSVVTSFTLVPTDGQPLPAHKAGQYLSIKFSEVPGHPYEEIRQYTISCAPNDTSYRISVKREDRGIVSNHLHDRVDAGDEVLIHMPHGDFTLDEASTRPIALISGGVGITPMLAMLERLIETSSERQVTFIHAAVDGSVHAFGPRLREIEKLHPNVVTAVFYEHPQEQDVLGRDYDVEGRVSYDALEALIPRHTDCYLCGPRGFMESVDSLLEDLRVPADSRHYEVFGPTTSLEKPALTT